MKLTTGQRAGLLFAAGVAALALVLYAKFLSLPYFLQHRAVASLLLILAFLVALGVAARALRASALAIVSVSAPLFLLLCVALIASPLPYELAHQALLLPRPAGESIPAYVATIPFYDAGHPVAIASFSYPPGRNVTALANETERAYQEAGWSTDPTSVLAGRSGPVAIVSAHKDAFLSYCTIADPEGTGPTIACNLSIRK